MARDVHETVLKANAARTVLLSRGGGPPVVVKRFHSQHPVRALRDRSRALCEHRLLTALHDLDVGVPRPLGVRRGGGSWEVVMRWIPGSTSLATLLEASGEGPRAPAGLEAPIGRLVARLHAAGLDHPDLHPGNVLIDGEGRPWLIDFHAARLRRRLEPRTLRRDLVALAAAVRETVPPAARARFLLGWWRALPARLSASLEDPRSLAGAVEDRARFHRRAVIEHAQGRWTRESGACTVEADELGTIYRSRAVAADVPARIEPLVPGEGPRVVRIEAGVPARSVLLLAGPSWDALAGRWYAAARLAGHHVPVLRPLCARRGPRNWTAFGWPEGGRDGGARIPAVLPQPDGRHPGPWGLRHPLGWAGVWDGQTPAPEAPLLGALLGRLHDRGLDLDRLGGGNVVSVGARLVLLPPPRLLHFDPRPGRAPRERRFRAVAGLGATEAPGFLASYVAAFRTGAEETARLARELGC